MSALAMLAAAESVFAEELHPRGTGEQGGQFVAKGSGGSGKAGAAHKGGAGRARPRFASRTLSFNGKRGTGYGHRGGDPRVSKLQTALNNLGIKDADGKPLAVDGNYGPKTTSAVKALQKRLGLPVDGKVTPTLLRKVLAMPGAQAKPKAKPSKAREAFASRAVRMMLFARSLESFNPAQHRDSHGRWSKGGGAVAAALAEGAHDALDGFSREQLRREAKRRGLSPRRGAPINEIRDMLHDHHANSGGKGASDPEHEPISPHLAQAAVAAAVSPDARGEDGVRNAYAALAAEPGRAVSLARLRSHMGGGRAEQDKALTDMALRGDIVLWPEENQKTIRPADHAAALRLGGEDKHLIMIERGRR